MSSLKSNEIRVFLQPKEVCQSFCQGTEFYLRFLLLLAINRILKSSFT